MARSLRGFCLAATFAVLSVALAGASCDKKPRGPEPVGGVNIVGVGDIEPVPTDRGEVQAPEPGKPYPDPRLDANQKAAYDALADKLPSPCGKPHSLRVSAETDPSCRRTPFATRYVKRWLAEEIPPDQVTELYRARFLQEKPFVIDTSKAAFTGVPNAPVQIVELFDYGCPHCRTTAPILEDLAAEYPSDVVVYYKHFPLNVKGPAVQAAMAAVAAQKQGKFAQMHRKLWSAFQEHDKETLVRHAREIGLDLLRFEADMNSPEVRERVMADRADGDKAEIHGTPTVFVNGREYIDALELEDLRDWVNEELAVNR